MQVQEKVYVFDIDGVVTNPYTKVPNQTILQFIADLLNKKEYVALVTGRAVKWIEQVILPEIKNKLHDKTLLDYLFLSGEMGSVTISFTEGTPKEHVDQSVILPLDVLQEAKEKVKGKEHLLFVDPDKKTLLTFEMQGGSEKEVEEQTAFEDSINEWLQKEVIPSHPEYETHVSSIALDLLKKGVNKKVSIEKLLQFLKEREATVESYVTFGDSPSDVVMAEALFEKGYPVTFVYVGPRPLEKDYSFPVITPSKGISFDAGVVEIIKQ